MPLLGSPSSRPAREPQIQSSLKLYRELAACVCSSQSRFVHGASRGVEQGCYSAPAVDMLARQAARAVLTGGRPLKSLFRNLRLV